MPEEERPTDWILKHDVLLFEWLDNKKKKEQFKRRNPKMKSAENMDNVVYVGD